MEILNFTRNNKEIELRVNGDYIETKRKNETDWSPMLSLDEIANRVGEIIVGVATEEHVGIVKSSEETNDVSVNDNGTMTVNEIAVNKLTNIEGSNLILDGGNISDL